MFLFSLGVLIEPVIKTVSVMNDLKDMRYKHVITTVSVMSDLKDTRCDALAWSDTVVLAVEAARIFKFPETRIAPLHSDRGL